MAAHDQPQGRLIAVDGSRGKDVAAAVAGVVAALEDAGVTCTVSRFDASGLFGELAMAASDDRRVSMRTLALVYAADLAFRLRWEIRPVLDAGGVVVAASYVDTAAAVGVAGGLPEAWIRDLLRFAPPPHARGRAHERKADRGWKSRTDRGYAEFCMAMLSTSAPRLRPKDARRAAIALLERKRPAKDARQIATAIRNSLRATPSRRRGRPRNARR